MQTNDLRSRALGLPGSSMSPPPSSADVEAVALAVVYVGDQVGRVADELAKLNEGVAVVGRGLVGLSLAWRTVATSVVRHVGDFAEQVAPATRNGAGEVIGRTVSVAAALRTDGES